MCMWESARHVWQITLQGCFGKKLRHWWGVWVVVGKTALASWGSWWGYSIRAVRGRRRASCGGIPLRSMCAVCVVDVPSAPSICRILPLTSLGVAGGAIGLCMQQLLQFLLTFFTRSCLQHWHCSCCCCCACCLQCGQGTGCS